MSVRVFGRLGLIWQLLIPSVLAIILSVTIVQSWTVAVTSGALETDIDTKLDTALALLETSTASLGGDWSRQGDQLLRGATPITAGFEGPIKAATIIHGISAIFSGDRRVATSLKRPDGTPLAGTRLDAPDIAKLVLQQGQVYRGKANIFGHDYFSEYAPIRTPAGEVIGMLSVSVPQDELTALKNRIIFHGLAIGVATVIAFGIIRAWMLIKTLSPINALSAVMMSVAGGDFDVEVPCLERTDQIGQFALAVNIWKDAAVDKRNLELEAEAQNRLIEEERERNDAARAVVLAAQSRVVEGLGTGLRALAAGDLSARIDETFAPEYEELRSDFNDAMDHLQEMVRSIVASTDALRSGNTEIASAADDLSQRTEQQAANLEQTAAALDEITATVTRTAEGAKRAAAVVARMRDDAERSGEVVRQTVSAMGSIEKSSQQITQITSVIDEIAFQTNLLALNAGVEAARAGESGRGFAIVATEVRALAQRSADAAREIKSVIATSSGQVSSGVRLVAQTGQALAGIVASVGEVKTVVTEIAAAAQEQATGLAEVNTAVNRMDEVTQKNAAMVEESNNACQSLALETAELVKLTGRFHLGQYQVAA
jgi:methyl-accepting chemotaxis protein